MRKLNLMGACFVAAILGGCATTSIDSLQCSLARILGQGCGAEVVQTSERWVRVQQAFDDEINQARQAQQKAVAASGSLSVNQQASAGEVATLNVTISDSKTQEKHVVRTLDTVAVNLPLAGKGKPGHLATFNAILDFANIVADNRGAASVTVYQNPADVKAGRANAAGSVLKSSTGKPVSVRKVADSNTPLGVERYVVKAGEVRGQL